MTNTVIIGLFVAFLLIAAAIAAIIAVVRLLSRPARRTPSPYQPSAAQLDLAPTDTTPATTLPSQAPMPPALPYARIPHLLTAAEGDFFAALQAAAPAGMLLFAQVRLANLVEVQPWARRDKTHWYKIQAKCVDFVFCEPRTFIPRLVIELDDSSHNRADRRERDAFVDEVLAAAGIPILHVRWQRRYDTGELSEQIAGRLGIAVAPPIVAPLPESIPAASDGLWRPIPIPPEPAPLYGGASMSASATTIVSARRACGQCQTELREGAKFCAHCGAVFAV